MIIQCDHCKTQYRVPPERMPAAGRRLRCSRCQHVFAVRAVTPSRPSILVAHGKETFRSFVKELLRDQPFCVLTAADGEEALQHVRREKPSPVLVDVGLPARFGFDLCETVKQDPRTRDIKIILCATVHNEHRYTRLPESLYGADAYLESHRVPDRLLPMLKSLQPALFETGSAGQKEEERDGRHPHPGPDTLPEQLRARTARLARAILSDIALYNRDQVDAGIRNGNLEEVLSEEIAEATDMMKRRFTQIEDRTLQQVLHNEIQVFKRKARARA